MNRATTKKDRLYVAHTYLTKEEDQLLTEMKTYYNISGSTLIRNAVSRFYQECYLPRIKKEDHSYDTKGYFV